MAVRLKFGKPLHAKRYFENKLRFTHGPAELKDMLDHEQHPTIVDVREPDDYDQGHIPGSVNVPEDQWNRTKVLSKKGLNIIYCYSPTCFLSVRACHFFASKGYPVAQMFGGFDSWEKEYNYPVERSRPRPSLRRVA